MNRRGTRFERGFQLWRKSFTVPVSAFIAFSSDPDGDTRAISGVSDPGSHFTTVSHSNVTHSVTIDDNNSTSNNTFNYTIDDGHGGTDTGSVSYQQDNSSLSGTSGSDILVGTTGNETFTGGNGRDYMIGGGGSDTYTFNDGESGNTLATADIVRDFDPANDHIDLSAVDAGPIGGGNQNFSDAGNGGFTQNAGVVAHGVTWHQQGADTVVPMDTDGNTASVEMMIVLTGVNANNLHASNFTG